MTWRSSPTIVRSLCGRVVAMMGAAERAETRRGAKMTKGLKKVRKMNA
jgi:hypothetical protein